MSTIYSLYSQGREFNQKGKIERSAEMGRAGNEQSKRNKRKGEMRVEVKDGRTELHYFLF